MKRSSDNTATPSSSAKRSRVDSGLRKRRHAVKVLIEYQESAIDDDQEYDFKKYETNLEKSVAKMKRLFDEGYVVEVEGKRLLTLMRETICWHREDCRVKLEEFQTLDKTRSTAESEEHVNLTKEIFGIVLGRRENLQLALNRAVRAVERKYPDESDLMKELKEVTSEFQEARAICYREFDSEQLRKLCRIPILMGQTSSWCKKMCFWEVN